MRCEECGCATQTDDDLCDHCFREPRCVSCGCVVLGNGFGLCPACDAERELVAAYAFDEEECFDDLLETSTY